ncbi:MAG: hypothetical protein M4579_002880 [Chaenotheca gracillima]|nr:MAG: hypothetical protein M4579_002880 [Chaenotheca gracillima]
MASNLLSFAGWAFLPNLVTGWTQSLYYGIAIRAGEPKPQPGSPRFIQHRRRIYVSVVTLYLLYTIYEADWQIRQAGDFYQSLGVPLDAEDRAIKSKFRRMAAIHHPDKVSLTEDRAATEAYFVHLRQAQDILLDPLKRFAYERFGPNIVNWRNCASIYDYVVQGLQAAAPIYTGGLVFLVALASLGYMEWGRYWRFLSTIALFAFECSVYTRPELPSILTKVVNPVLTRITSHPPYLPFQLITLLRKALLTVYIAMNQLGPFIQPQPATPTNTEATQRQQLDRLEQLSSATDIEASRLLGLDMAPFAGEEKTMGDLRVRLQNWLVQNTIRTDPEVRDAVGRVMGKRRTGAPAGARGTRTQAVPAA